MDYTTLYCMYINTWLALWHHDTQNLMVLTCSGQGHHENLLINEQKKNMMVQKQKLQRWQVLQIRSLTLQCWRRSYRSLQCRPGSHLGGGAAAAPVRYDRICSFYLLNISD